MYIATEKLLERDKTHLPKPTRVINMVQHFNLVGFCLELNFLLILIVLMLRLIQTHLKFDLKKKWDTQVLELKDNVVRSLREKQCEIRIKIEV